MARSALLLLGFTAAGRAAQLTPSGRSHGLALAQMSAMPAVDPEEQAAEAVHKHERHMADSLTYLRAKTELVRKRLTGALEISSRQELRSALREAEAAGVNDTAAMDRARTTLVDSISVSARKAITKGLEGGTPASLQAAVQEAAAKSGEIEKLWAKVYDPNATAVAKTRFQVLELEDVKHKLANENAKEARKLPARLRLVSATNGHNPEKTQKALAEAAQLGLSAVEIEEAKVALANQLEEAKAVDGMKLALQNKDIAQLEATIKEGEKANVKETTLNGFRKKLLLLKEPPKPKVEKQRVKKSDDKKAKAAMLKEVRKAEAAKDTTQKTGTVEAGAELSEHAAEAVADI